MGCIVDFLLAGCDANAANVCACVRAWLKVFLPHGHLCSVSYVRGTKGTEGNQMEFLLWGGLGARLALGVRLLQERRKEVSHWMPQGWCRSSGSGARLRRPRRGQRGEWLLERKEV